MTRKWLAVGVILLFIGVAVAPSVTFKVVKASPDSDFIEVTSQACGIQVFGNTTVRLTKEQYQSLGKYLVDFRARLNQTTTREEAVPLFKDAVVELDKYGLLPKGMSVEQAQRLVLGRPCKAAALEQAFQGASFSGSGVRNMFCLVAGNTSNNFIVGPIKGSVFLSMLLLMDVLFVIAVIADSFGLEKVVDLFFAVDDFLEHLWLPARVIPFEIGGAVTFGNSDYEWDVGMHYFHSDGWVQSFGLLGSQSLNGSMFGTLRGPLGGLSLIGLYIGLSGFTGIVIRPWKTGQLVFLGSALRAGLDVNPPEYR